MAIAKVGSSWGGTQSGVTNTTLPLTAQAVSVGDFVVVGWTGRASQTALTISSSLGNTYASLSSILGTTSGGVWAGFITVGGTETITVGWTGAGAGAAAATRWSGVAGTTGSTALDVAVVTQTGGTAISVTSAATVTRGDLVLAYLGANNNVADTAQAFTPTGTAFAVPDTTFLTSGTDNCHAGMSETLAGAAGSTQKFTATANNTTSVTFLMVFKPADTFPPRRRDTAYLTI